MKNDREKDMCEKMDDDGYYVLVIGFVWWRKGVV